MTTITNIKNQLITVEFFPNTIPGAFCNKKYKFIRVAADLTSRLCLALFYQIISSLCWIARFPKAQHYYKALASHSLLKTNNFFHYLKFGNEILDFSLNTPNKIQDFQNINENKIEALKNLYGNTTIDQKIQDSGAIIKLDELKMEVEDGCCFGMSLDFISSYLMNVKLGKPPLEAVVGRYRDGAPDKAVLEQIFYSALHFSIVDEYFNKIKEDLESSKEFYLEMLKNKSPKKRKALVAQVEQELIFVNKTLELSILKIPLEVEQAIINSCGLIMDAKKSYVCQFKKMGEEPSFENFTKSLRPGVYEIGISNSRKTGHSMVYIKTDEGKHIIYDPNIGILAVAPSVSAIRLYEIVKKYKKGEDSYVSFLLCSLPINDFTDKS